MSVYQGVLLIGGQSRRMGEPKSLIARGEMSLAAFLCELLTWATGHPPVLLGQGPFDGPELVCINDREAGAGPLSALLGLYDALPDTSFLVLATDLYAMNRHALGWLVGVARMNERPTVWPRLPQRNFGEPLAAIYLHSARQIMEQQWNRGERSLRHSFTDDQRYQPEIPEEYQLAFTGANTPEELARLKAQL